MTTMLPQEVIRYRYLMRKYRLAYRKYLAAMQKAPDGIITSEQKEWRNYEQAQRKLDGFILSLIWDSRKLAALTTESADGKGECDESIPNAYTSVK